MNSFEAIHGGDESVVYAAYWAEVDRHAALEADVCRLLELIRADALQSVQGQAVIEDLKQSVGD